MEVEMSNFVERAIPKSCPKEMRAKIQEIREQRTKPVTTDTELWNAMKSFASAQAEQ